MQGHRDSQVQLDLRENLELLEDKEQVDQDQMERMENPAYQAESVRKVTKVKAVIQAKTEMFEVREKEVSLAYQDQMADQADLDSRGSQEMQDFQDYLVKKVSPEEMVYQDFQVEKAQMDYREPPDQTVGMEKTKAGLPS